MDRRGFLQDRQLLSSMVSKETWQKLNEAVQARRQTLSAILHMEPWLAAFTIEQDGYARAGLRPDDSLEGYIERLAIDDRKPVGALETAKDQILAMADTPRADQEEFLKSVLEGLDSLESKTQELRDAWVGGNEGQLQSALGLTSASTPSGMDASLIGNRNNHWVAKIKDLANRKTDSLIVVGVEHLVSAPFSLPELLQQAGLSVRRVDSRSDIPRSKEPAKPVEYHPFYPGIPTGR